GDRPIPERQGPPGAAPSIYFASLWAILQSMRGIKDIPVHFRDADKRELLQNNYLFSKLSAKQIDRLAACVVGKSVLRGTSLFAKGDPGSSLFAICRGTVKVSAPSVDGHDAVFNVFGKGDIFGEIALLDGRPRTADAIAVTDCELFIIERRGFLPPRRGGPGMTAKGVRDPGGRGAHTAEQGRRGR